MKAEVKGDAVDNLSVERARVLVIESNSLSKIRI